MEIASYIIQILKEQDQVVVPGLGSFVAEYKPAKIHPVDHSFLPPAKQLVFDNFTPEDDFLIRKIAESENISTEKAIIEVRNFTDNLITEIQKYKKTTIKNLGVFVLNIDNTISFTSETEDISDESFGLGEFKSSPVVKNDLKEKFLRETQIARDMDIAERRRKKLLYIIASVVLITALLFLAFFTDIFRNIIYNNEAGMERPKSALAVQENTKIEPIVESKIMDSTNAVVDKAEVPQPAEIEKAKTDVAKKSETAVEKPKIETNKYYLVAGSFKVKENAESRVSELKSKGYKKAAYLQPNNKGLYTVYYNSYTTKEDAEAEHQKVMKEENPESWVLKNK